MNRSMAAFILVFIMVLSVPCMVTSQKVSNVSIETEPVDDSSEGCDCEMKRIIHWQEKYGFLSEGHAMGLIPDDPETMSLYTSSVVEGDPPECWDWRDAEINGIHGDWTTPVRDQALCGSCWAFGILAALESVYNIKNGDPDTDIDLSEQYMISCGTDAFPFNLNGCCGGTLYHSLLFLQTHGAIREECFPYKSLDDHGRNYLSCRLFIIRFEPVECSQKCENWNENRIGITEHVMLLDDVSIKNALVEYGPIPASMMTYSDFNDYSGGVYEPKIEIFSGYHLICIVGYNDTEGYWICKNSWGTDWGEDVDGYSWDMDGDERQDHEGGWFRIKYGKCGIGDPNTLVCIKDIEEGKTTSKSLTTSLDGMNLWFSKLFKLLFPKNILGL